MTDEKKRRPFIRRAAFSAFWTLTVLAALAGGGWWLVGLPNSPLPDHWNPRKDLVVTAPVTPVTKLQLMRAVADEATCRAVLDQAGVAFSHLDDLVVNENCGIAGRGRLTGLTSAGIEPVETRCATALRLTLWEHHVVQPAARELLGTEVSELLQIGSYNCRKIRGSTDAWSSHATADGIDITGMRLADGRRLTLLADWQGDGPEAAFLRQIWKGSCTWFRLVLGPDYNRLHADHFHMQNTGWGFCR
ncbi:extensin family protein [Aliiroseovarius sp.]|uniref:extensin-like domain-containing protein n=1 Tax=Aliiroseovarius sp. TaxID=1872442 RepID=UPI003BAC9F68